MGDGSPNAALDSGLELFKQGKAADALPLLQQAVEMEPSSTAARSYLGACCAQLGRFDDAIAQFTELTNLQPNIAAHYYNLGFAYQSCGKKAEAITAYGKAVAINPAHDKAKAALDALKAENQPAPVQTTAIPTPPAQQMTPPPPAPPGGPAYRPPTPQQPAQQPFQQPMQPPQNTQYGGYQSMPQPVNTKVALDAWPSWVIILLLVCCGFIGVIIMWFKSSWSTTTKGIITAIWVVLALAQILTIGAGINNAPTTPAPQPQIIYLIR